MEQVENRPAGFDYLRLCLAVSIIAWHSIAVCYGMETENPLWMTWFRPVIFFVLPSFFALSGFLVAGSLERNAIPEFVALRVLRIFPALAVEVLVSALIIGPLVTTLPLADYFSDGLFFHYFRNMVGDIQYVLPGVFGEQPVPSLVNLQLWTVPYELECYVAIFGLAIIGLVRRPGWLFVATVALALMIAGKATFMGPLWPLDGAMRGRGLVVCFLFGLSLYRLRAVVPYSALLFVVSLVCFTALCFFAQTICLTALPIAYITLFLGLRNPGRIFLVRGADYSYGIYLYGYPIQQSVSYFFPNLRNPFFNVAISLVLVSLLASLSWTLIESKVLHRKKAILRLISSIGLLRFSRREGVPGL